MIRITKNTMTHKTIMNYSKNKYSSAQQFVSFTIDNFLMGIDILKIREVLPVKKITAVQHAPDFIWGLMNLRGQTITIIDLGVIFGLPGKKLTRDSHNIIMKNLNLGIVVDSIGDIVTAHKRDIEPCPANTDKKICRYLENVAKIDNEIMAILCLEKIIKQITV